MIINKAKAKLKDSLNHKKVIAEVNWSKTDQDSIKFTTENNTFTLSKAELFELIFSISNEEQQTEMLSVKKEQVRCYSRRHTVKLTKDLKAGDTVNVWCEINIPLLVEEGLKKEFIKENKEVHQSHIK